MIHFLLEWIVVWTLIPGFSLIWKTAAAAAEKAAADLIFNGEYTYILDSVILINFTARCCQGRSEAREEKRTGLSRPIKDLYIFTQFFFF